MKHFTLISLALVAATAAQAQVISTGSAPRRFSLAGAKAAAKGTRGAQAQARAADYTTVYMPMSETLYDWQPDDEANPTVGSWVKSSTYSYEYNNQLKQTKVVETTYDEDGEVEGVNKTENKYNRYNYLTEQVESTSDDGGATFVNSTRRVQTYDLDTPWLTLSKDRYVWDTDQNKWVATNDAFQRMVTYDRYGNIASLTVSVPYEGSWDQTIRITTTTDQTTGKINTFKYEELKAGWDDTKQDVYYYWNETTYLRDIVWKATTGRLAGDIDTWAEHGDLMQSATISYTKDDGTIDDYGTIDYTYGDNGSYDMTADYRDLDTKELVKESEVQTMTDSNGSYRLDKTTWVDVNGDGRYMDDELESASSEIATFNDMGELVLDKTYEYEPDEGEYGDTESYAADVAEGEVSSDDTVELNGVTLALMGMTKYDISYDPWHSNLRNKYVQYEYDFDAAAMVPMMKVVVDSFVGVETTGVQQPADAAADAPQAVYNMQGMRVPSASVPGMYIVRKGGKAVKVAVK